MAGFAGGLARGLGAGLQYGQQQKQWQAQQEEQEHQRQRQARQDEMAEERHGLQMDKAQSQMDWRDQEQDWKAQDRAQDQTREATMQVAGWLQEGNTELANRWIAEHPGVAEQLAGLDDGTTVNGIMEMGDGEFGISVSRPNGATGPLTENRGDYMDGDPPVVFGVEDLMRMADPEYSASEGYEMVRDAQGNPIAQRDADGRVHSLPDSMLPQEGDADWRRLNDGSLYNQRTGEVRQGEALGLGTSGAGGGLSGTDEKRLYDRALDRVQRVLRTQLGEDFIGDPDNAQLHSAADRVSSELVSETMGNVPPELIGNAAIEMALSEQHAGLRRGEATRMAREQLSEEGGGMFSRGPGEEAVEELAGQIQQEAFENYRADVRRRLEMEAGGQQGGLQAGQQPASGQQPAAGGQQPSQQPTQQATGGPDPSEVPWGDVEVNPSAMPGSPDVQPRSQPRQQPQQQDQPPQQGLSLPDEGAPEQVGLPREAGAGSEAREQTGRVLSSMAQTGRDLIGRGVEGARGLQGRYMEAMGVEPDQDEPGPLTAGARALGWGRDFVSPGVPSVPDEARTFVTKYNEGQTGRITPQEKKAVTEWLKSNRGNKTEEMRQIARALLQLQNQQGSR